MGIKGGKKKSFWGSGDEKKCERMDVGALQGVMLIFAVVLFLIDIENFRLGKYVIGIVTLVVGIVSVTAVFCNPAVPEGGSRVSDCGLFCSCCWRLPFCTRVQMTVFPAVVSAYACYHFGSAWNASLGHRFVSDSACGSWRFSGRRLRIY